MYICAKDWPGRILDVWREVQCNQMDAFVLLVAVVGKDELNGLDSNDSGVDESSGVEGGQSQEGEH